MEWATLIIGVMGGGGIAGWINILLNQRTIRKNREIEVLKEQIQKLYGPLHFFVSQNKILVEVEGKLYKAGNAVYGAASINNKDEAGMSKTIDIANEYMVGVRMNNDKIYSLLCDNYSYLDVDDMDKFAQFSMSHLRMKTEWDSAGLKIPYLIYKHIEESLGSIAFLTPEFIKRVEEKLQAKKRQYEELTKG